VILYFIVKNLIQICFIDEEKFLKKVNSVKYKLKNFLSVTII